MGFRGFRGFVRVRFVCASYIMVLFRGDFGFRVQGLKRLGLKPFRD